MKATIFSLLISYLFLMPIASSGADSVPLDFNNCALHGTYAYKNVAQDVASFGVIRFDGKGNASLDIRINGRDPEQKTTRRTLTATGKGTYEVGPSGIGHVNISFSGIAIKQGTYDFVLIDQSEGVASTVFAVLRDGGRGKWSTG